MTRIFIIILSVLLSFAAPAIGLADPTSSPIVNVDAPVPAIDFALVDSNGDTLRLSSMKGSIVVIDFWGTWCTWCVKGFPKMKEFYAKHKGEFEIISVDCGDKMEMWQRAIKLLALPWRNVYQEKDNKVSRDYSIKGFPTKIIVDEEGMMIYSVTGEDPKFYDKLEKVLKERKK